MIVDCFGVIMSSVYRVICWVMEGVIDFFGCYIKWFNGEYLYVNSV